MGRRIGAAGELHKLPPNGHLLPFIGDREIFVQTVFAIYPFFKDYGALVFCAAVFKIGTILCLRRCGRGLIGGRPGLLLATPIIIKIDDPIGKGGIAAAGEFHKVPPDGGPTLIIGERMITFIIQTMLTRQPILKDLETLTLGAKIFKVTAVLTNGGDRARGGRMFRWAYDSEVCPLILFKQTGKNQLLVAGIVVAATT